MRRWYSRLFWSGHFRMFTKSVGKIDPWLVAAEVRFLGFPNPRIEHEMQEIQEIKVSWPYALRICSKLQRLGLNDKQLPLQKDQL